MISWSYYGLQAWKYLFGRSMAADISYKILFFVVRRYRRGNFAGFGYRFLRRDDFCNGVSEYDRTVFSVS
jgi:hypothetical protein